MAAVRNQKAQTILLHRLLSLHSGVSPLNVVFDSVEQCAKPLLIEYVRRANIAETKVIYLSFESIKCPFETAHFIDVRHKTLFDIRARLGETIQNNQKYLIIIDSVVSITSLKGNVPEFLSSLITDAVTIIAVNHSSLPNKPLKEEEYWPPGTALLDYLATTVVTVHSLFQIIAKHDAAQLSRTDPVFGLQEELDGVLAGKGANSRDGILVQMDHRRKSGKSIGLQFTVEKPKGYSNGAQAITLAHEHSRLQISGIGKLAEEATVEVGTFNLTVTQEQKDARESIVLPYLDAQAGNNEGGRILYDMGKEDDFDEEDDEL